MNVTFKAAVAALVLTVAFARSVAAGPLEDALDAAQRGDYATAIRLWRPLADKGEADAQYNLGVMYDKGQGVTRDYVVAVSWFRKAADQGFAAAQLSLAWISTERNSPHTKSLESTIFRGISLRNRGKLLCKMVR